MRITNAWLRKHNACRDGISAFEEQEERDLAKLVWAAHGQGRFDWAVWLITRSLSKKQNVQLAIYSAELVLPEFEKAYPDDARPRQAIEAAKAYLKRPCKQTKEAAGRAAEEAGRAAWAGRAGRAARAAEDAAWAAERDWQKARLLEMLQAT